MKFRTSTKGADVQIYKSLPTEHAVHAAIELCKPTPILNDKQIKLLVSRCDDSTTAATEVIRFLVARKPPNKSFANPKHHDLALARDLAWSFPPTDPVASENLIKQLAIYGFIGCLEDLSTKLLGRNITPEEILALTKHYCDDMG